MTQPAPQVNGTTKPEKKLTRVAVLVKQHREERKGKPLTGKPAKDLIDAFKKAVAEKDKAEAARDAAQKAMNDMSEAMILAFGDKRISIDGRIFFPASRFDTAFYRELGKQDPDDIIEA